MERTAETKPARIRRDRAGASESASRKAAQERFIPLLRSLVRAYQAFTACDEKDVRKHRNDVVRMLQLLSADAVYSLPPPVHDDMTAFVAALSDQQDFDPKQFSVNMTRDVVVERLRAAYRL